MAARLDRQTIERLAAQFVAELRNHRVPVRGVYLFGSAVSGTMDEWSDIDVAVLVDEYGSDRFDFHLQLLRIARKVSLDIEPHPFRTTDFTPGMPLVDEIQQHGRKVA